MTKIINSTEGKRLWELDQFYKMLSDDYLSDENNLQTKFIYEQFFSESPKGMLAKERLALLNLSYSLPSLITEKFSDYVGQPRTSLEDFEIDDYISAFIWGGMAIMRPSVIDGEFIVNYVRPSQYILEDNGNDRILTYYEKENKNNEITNYVLEETFEKNIIYRKLYKVSKEAQFDRYAVEGTEVALNIIQETANLSDIEVLPNINYSPIVTIHNRKIKWIKYGTSEIRKVRSLISSIEIEAVNIQDQFLKHLQAKLALPRSAMITDKNGRVKVKDLEAFGLETGDILPSFIVNSNPLIDKSFQQIEDFIRQIAAILSLPTEFMGLKESSGAAESEGTKKIRLVSFIKKIETIRAKFEKGLKKINEIRKAWDKGNAEDELLVEWDDVFPENTMALATELATAQDAKLISNKKAIMLYQKINEQEALEEQKIINEENANIDTNDLPV